MALFWSGVESQQVYHAFTVDPTALVTFALPASKESLDSGTIAAECSYRIRINSTDTRTEDNDNCSHAILLACPTNGPLEYESPLRFHLLQEPVWNLFQYAIILVISGCLVFGMHRCGRTRIASGKDIGIFLRVFCHRLDHQDSHKKIGTDDRINFIGKQVKAVTHFFKYFNTRKQQCGKDGATLLSWTYCFGFVMASMVILVITDTKGQVNLTTVLLLMFFIFIVSIVNFFSHIKKNELRGHCSEKTLFIKMDRSKFNPEENPMYFLLQKVPRATDINPIRNVAKLEALEEQLQVAKETKKMLQDATGLENNNKIAQYSRKIAELDKDIGKEVAALKRKINYSAFITFKTYKDALDAKNQLGSQGMKVEWAPPVQDCQWSKLHDNGTWCSVLSFSLNLVTYIVRALVVVLGTSIMIWLFETFPPKNDIIRDQLRPIMTMICMGISFILGTTHTNSQSGLFWSALVEMILTEIILPSFSLMDPHELLLWLTTSPCKFTRILLCSFRQDLGKLFSALIIRWTFIKSAILITRLSEIFHSVRIKLTARCNEENSVLYRRRTVNYDIGLRYAELQVQAIATLIGYFSYPPIVIISAICMGVRYIVDFYNVCYIFTPTSSGPEMHRYPVYCALTICPWMCVLLFLYIFAYQPSITEETPLWELITTIILSSLFFLTVICWLKKRFFSSPKKIAKDTGPNTPKYASPIWTLYAPNEDINREISGITRDHTAIDIELKDEIIPSELGKIMKGVFYFFIAFLAVGLVIVLPIRYYLLVPDIQIVSVGQVELAGPSEYTLEMYQGRLPWALMNNYCCGRNVGENFGTLNIETQCEDMLIDSVIRSNFYNVFKNLKPNQRLMWTGGYYNLRESDNFLWVDPTAKTDYRNFCMNQTIIIANAKRRNEDFLYIVKDYRGEGDACWQVYSLMELSGFYDGRPNQWNEPGPRLPFVCKFVSPLDAELLMRRLTPQIAVSRFSQLL